MPFSMIHTGISCFLGSLQFEIKASDNILVWKLFFYKCLRKYLMFINTYLFNFSTKCCFFKEYHDQWLLTILEENFNIFKIRTIILNCCRCFYILVSLGGNIIEHSSIILLKYSLRFLCCNWYIYSAFV